MGWVWGQSSLQRHRTVTCKRIESHHRQTQDASLSNILAHTISVDWISSAGNDVSRSAQKVTDTGLVPSNYFTEMITSCARNYSIQHKSTFPNYVLILGAVTSNSKYDLPSLIYSM